MVFTSLGKDGTNSSSRCQIFVNWRHISESLHQWKLRIPKRKEERKRATSFLFFSPVSIEDKSSLIKNNNTRTS